MIKKTVFVFLIVICAISCKRDRVEIDIFIPEDFSGYKTIFFSKDCGLSTSKMINLTHHFVIINSEPSKYLEKNGKQMTRFWTCYNGDTVPIPMYNRSTMTKVQKSISYMNSGSSDEIYAIDFAVSDSLHFYITNDDLYDEMVNTNYSLRQSFIDSDCDYW